MSDPANSQADVNLVPLTEGGLELELSEMETLSVKTLLEANGIQVMVVGASQMPNLPYELLVPESQLQDAIQVIKDSQQGLPPETGESA